MAATEDTLAERFAESWINRVHRVVGRQLDPYCLHHVLVLSGLRNPLLTGEGKITWGHLIEALLVCSTPYESEIRFDRSSLWRLRIWLLRSSLPVECARFRAYQNDFLSEPDLFNMDAGRELAAPGMLAKVVFLQMHLHMDERRIWTMPIGKALWHYAAAAEQLSSEVSLLDKGESDLLRIVKLMQEGKLSADLPLPGERRGLSPDMFGKDN